MDGDDHLISSLYLIHQLALAGSRLSSSAPRPGEKEMEGRKCWMDLSFTWDEQMNMQENKKRTIRGGVEEDELNKRSIKWIFELKAPLIRYSTSSVNLVTIASCAHTYASQLVPTSNTIQHISIRERVKCGMAAGQEVIE